MSEAAPEGGSTGGETPPTEEFKAIESQDDLNKVINERLTRERAKFADYKDLKTKAAEFDKLQAATLTEFEKSAAKVNELETALNTMRTETARLRIASAHGITDADDIELFLTGTDDDTLTKQAKRLAERTADRKKNGNVSPREGNNPTSTEGDGLQTVRALFGG